MKLHHIGIVVKDIQKSLGELGKYFEFKETTIPTLVKSQKVNVCFLKSSDVYIELIEPIDDDSPVKSMAESESSREDGIEVVSIVTPNHMHASPSIEFLKKTCPNIIYGINTLCNWINSNSS